MAKGDKKQRRHCTGKRADGRPCANAPIPGTTRCYHHSFRVPGRPSKLTAELVERIVDAVLEGNYLETAAQVAGINKTTLYRWLRKADELEAAAREHIEDEDLDDAAGVYDRTNPADWVYLDFRHALKSAEAYAETELLRRTLYAQPGWQASMTVLERRHPDRWRRRESRDVNFDGVTDAPASQKVAPDTDETRRQVAAILQASGALDAGENTQPEEDPDA